MRKPLQATQEAFCKLAAQEAVRKGMTKNKDVTDAAKVGPHTWISVRENKMPDLRKASERQRRSWIRTVTRLCETLELDLNASLEACGLPKDETIIGQGRDQLKGRRYSKDIQVTEDNLKELLRMAKNFGKPLPLSFILQYLSLSTGKKLDVDDLPLEEEEGG